MDIWAEGQAPPENNVGVAAASASQNDSGQGPSRPSIDDMIQRLEQERRAPANNRTIG